MKLRVLATVAALFTANAYANDIALPRPDVSPTIMVGAYDIQTAPAQLLGDATISKSNPNHRMCWRIENIAPNAEHRITEHIISPAFATFVDKDAQNGRSPSGVYHRIIRTVTTDASGAFQKCWQFGDTDPNGQYEVQVEAGTLQFPVRIFFVGN